MPNYMDSLLNKIWQGYSHDVGKSLIHLGAAGWLFSALAQIGMISCNTDISKKDKRFLIPQEISDGLINVTLYYSICQLIKSFGDRLSETGKITNKKMATFFKTLDISSDKFAAIAKSMKKHSLSDIGAEKPITGILNGITEYLKGENIDAINAFSAEHPQVSAKINDYFKNMQLLDKVNFMKNIGRNFISFKNGIGVFTAVSASVIASNIVTPVLRNKSANFFQKKLSEQRKVDVQRIDYNFVEMSKLPRTFNSFKI